MATRRPEAQRRRGSLHEDQMRRLIAALALLLPVAAAAADAPDANLVTTYALSADATRVGWTTCGHTAGSSGCYGSGNLGRFHRMCAMLQGAPSINGNLVSRQIFVLDSGADPSVGPRLSVYQRRDRVGDVLVSSAVGLKARIDLPMLKPGAPCFMAANDVTIYVGTGGSTNAVAIDRATQAVTAIPGFSPPMKVTGITADARGYVSVQFENGYYLYNPAGYMMQDGGGAALVLGQTSATLFNP